MENIIIGIFSSIISYLILTNYSSNNNVDFFYNISLCICICIFIYLVLDLFDNLVENFSNNNNLFKFKCVNNNEFNYTNNIKFINDNLHVDGYILSKSYESNKLLKIYDTLICDLNNLTKENISNMKVINLLSISLDPIKSNYEIIELIFEDAKIKTENLIKEISSVSVENTNQKYLYPNKHILNNVKQEMLMIII